MTIFEFDDYRLYLKSWLRSLPKHGRGEINRMALHLGINATAVSQTLSGSRDFSSEQALEVAEFIGLSDLESDFFSLLVQIERAGTQKLKTNLKRKLSALKKESVQLSKRVKTDRKLTEVEQSIFYSSYLYPAIRMFCSIDGGQTLESISQRFGISRARANDVLDFLTSCGLCISSKDKYSMGPQTSHLDQDSPFIHRHRANWRIQSLKHAELISREELMFSGVMAISKKDFTKVRERLAEFIKELYQDVKNTEAEDVAIINLDYFWLQK